MEQKILPLNIVMTYPVRWGRYKIFRDYIQNFFDAVGPHDWKKRFKYNLEDGKLSMWVEGVVFSYEWLLHIGASTKTNSNCAGYFGEGFKIASLCALRDYKWTINMSSGDWSLNVIKIPQTIDEKDVEMLAYEVTNRDLLNESRLELYPIEEKDYRDFEAALMSFYYEENPLLGESIWEGEEGAIYLCNTDQYNIDLPYSYKYGRKGAVFCAYQLLGSNPFGLCFCMHNYKQEDRERSTLYDFEVTQVLGQLCTYVSPKAAITILEKMRRLWNTVPKKKIDVGSWAPVIRTLIVRIAISKSAAEIFHEKYPYMLYLPPIHNVREKNRRSEAYAWMKQQEKKYLVVQVAFEMLGYPSLEEECDRNGGFVLDGNPNEREERYIKILEDATYEIYSMFFNIEKENMPERKIITNYAASYHGMASLKKGNISKTNEYGLKLKYTVNQIYLKRSVFREDGFYDAFSTYIHEYCHTFGGDASQSFSLALTIAIELLMENHMVLQKYKRQWEELFASEV